MPTPAHAPGPAAHDTRPVVETLDGSLAPTILLRGWCCREVGSHEREDIGCGTAFGRHFCHDLRLAVSPLAEGHWRWTSEWRVHKDVANHLPGLIELRPQLGADFPRIKHELAVSQRHLDLTQCRVLITTQVWGHGCRIDLSKVCPQLAELCRLGLQERAKHGIELRRLVEQQLKQTELHGEVEDSR